MIFAMPKPFSGHIGVIQENAIRSWCALKPACEIILFGDEEGTAEIAARFGIRHEPDVDRNEFGTPLVSSLFERARQLSSAKTLAYVNADIILAGSLDKVVESTKFERFLVLGRRRDVEITTPLNFDREYFPSRFLSEIIPRTVLHGPAGIDFFIYPRDLYQNIPQFALGRVVWDNWLVYHAAMVGATIIDATEVITAIHQNHDYSHHQDGERGVWLGAERNRNLQLAGGWGHAFTIRDADCKLSPEGIEPIPISLERLMLYPFRRYDRARWWAKPLLIAGWFMVVSLRQWRNGGLRQ